ncbi:sensor histidine kinase [Mesorhizobium sp. NZP2234]|uniref:sensor histidine kinase n=1 Tax=Mesorhizobium sp. NZP2234 TaxID=2483402 RepID=UPI001555C7C6|nr:sensor histidine kinase [Mesorhizobium sp. NZP2234]
MEAITRPTGLAMSVAPGRIDVDVTTDGGETLLVWRETGRPQPSLGAAAGFGSRLERGLTSALGAAIERDWQPAGLVVSIAVSKAAICV